MTNRTGQYASSPCMMHEVWPEPDATPRLVPVRLVPHRPLPAYAYLPGGRFPHPVRDHDGHSHGEAAPSVSSPSQDSEVFRWGADLFNHGYYWEAHEAWEPLWRAAATRDPRRGLLKGLILLSAAGVKVCEGKAAACAKHASRAATLFRAVATQRPDLSGLGMTPACLAQHAEGVAEKPPRGPDKDEPASVFDFVLRPS